MTVPQKRAALAEAITEGLENLVTVHPYMRNAPRAMTGWLEIDRMDQDEEVTYGEVRLTVTCHILVGRDRTAFEKVQDAMGPDLITAIQNAGGRAVAVQPYSDTVGDNTFFHLSAQFLTESEVA